MPDANLRRESPASQIHHAPWRFGSIEHYALGHTRSIEGVSDGVWDEIAEVWCEEGDEALAHLVNAAPLMYEALEHLANAVASIDPEAIEMMDQSFVERLGLQHDQARAALAKARGEK